MKPALWAEINRLSEYEKCSYREIARQLKCSKKTVKNALACQQPQSLTVEGCKRKSKLDAFKPLIKEILEDYPRLSAERIGQKIREQGYLGGQTILKDFLAAERVSGKRVYQPVNWRAGEGMQVDWGDCGKVMVGETERKVSVFVAALCYSRLLYIEFTLDQKKETFYRCIIAALNYFDGSPKKIIVDNLKAAVQAGHGPTARFHPEFIDLVSYYRMQAVACRRRDPESKGIVEAGVRYVKHNALAGRKLVSWEEYQPLAAEWMSRVNVRLHSGTGKVPQECLTREKLLPLPNPAYDTRAIHQCIVNSHAQVTFETNRYSVPPEVARKPVTLKADEKTIWIFFQDREIARHFRTYEKKTMVIYPAHRQAALRLRGKENSRVIEAKFGDLGPIAIAFSEGLRRSSHQPQIQMRKLLKLIPLYGKRDFLRALETATEFNVFQAGDVENLIQQNRRRLALGSPLPLSPINKELLTDDLEEPDLDFYEQLIQGEDDDK